MCRQVIHRWSGLLDIQHAEYKLVSCTHSFDSKVLGVKLSIAATSADANVVLVNVFRAAFTCYY